MINVTCGIIEFENKILVTQRSSTMSLPGKWEFPGGKIEQLESPEACLKREIYEELNLHVEIKQPLSPNQHRYGNRVILLIPFVCKLVGGKLILREHAQFVWATRDELNDFDWADADVPILNEYLTQLKNGTGNLRTTCD